MELSSKNIRVLGSLMEKARTTPEAYPLTLNSLVNACNQKTSREPVTDYDEDEVLAALDELRELGLVMRVDLAGSRTAKFRENLSTQWTLNHKEYALLAILFLRGGQTPGQLRQRSDRLHPFTDLQEVHDQLHQMQEREEEPHCLVRSLPRTAGTKEIRFEHTLLPETVEATADSSGEPSPPGEGEGSSQPSSTTIEERFSRIETRLKELEDLLNELTQ